MGARCIDHSPTALSVVAGGAKASDERQRGRIRRIGRQGRFDVRHLAALVLYVPEVAEVVVGVGVVLADRKRTLREVARGGIVLRIAACARVQEHFVGAAIDHGTGGYLGIAQ